MKSFYTDNDSSLEKPERTFIYYENVCVSFTEELNGPTFFLLDFTRRILSFNFENPEDE